jgi:hypothetical protein
MYLIFFALLQNAGNVKYPAYDLAVLSGGNYDEKQMLQEWFNNNPDYDRWAEWVLESLADSPETAKPHSYEWWHNWIEDQAVLIISEYRKDKKEEDKTALLKKACEGMCFIFRQELLPNDKAILRSQYKDFPAHPLFPGAKDFIGFILPEE